MTSLGHAVDNPGGVLVAPRVMVTSWGTVVGDNTPETPLLWLCPPPAWLLPWAEVWWPFPLRAPTSPAGSVARRVAGAGGVPRAWTAPGRALGGGPAPLPGPGAHARVLGPVQGAGMYWGVSSKAWDGGKGPQRPLAWPRVAAEAQGLLTVTGGDTEAAGPRGPAAPAPLSGLPRPPLQRQLTVPSHPRALAPGTLPGGLATVRRRG